MLPTWRAGRQLLLLLLGLFFPTVVAGAELAPVVDAAPIQAGDPHSGEGSAGSLESTSAPAAKPWTEFCSECGGRGCPNCLLTFEDGRHALKLYGGVDYLQARPTFSEPLAFVRQIRATAPDINGLEVNVDQDIYFEYDRKDTIRAFLGFRLNDCLSELQFTYWRLRSDDFVTGTAGADAAGNDIFYDIWDVNAIVPGDQLTAMSQVTGDVYDVEYKRTIRWPNACDTSGAWCVPWDLRWSAGLRIAEWQYATNVASTATSPTQADVLMEYDGAGPMIGFDGGRSLRILPRASAYASFRTALLLGQYHHEMVRTATSGPNASREVFLADQKRMVPVTEFEVGVRWQFGRSLRISGGWFHQAWWDLGMGEDVVRGGDSEPDLAGIDFVRDDANIMAWDGLMVRAEFSY